MSHAGPSPDTIPIMVPVLLIFLSPFGAGIPAGVLLAQGRGLAWPVTAGLYLVSDVLLALFFEPVLRLGVAWGRRVPFLARLGGAVQAALTRPAAPSRRKAVGPFSLILIAFGVDPMTGRATALAAGHGFAAGWALAITGDMLYYALIAVATLRLNAYFRNPNRTMLVVLVAMFLVPALIKRVGASFRGPVAQPGALP